MAAADLAQERMVVVIKGPRTAVNATLAAAGQKAEIIEQGVAARSPTLLWHIPPAARPPRTTAPPTVLQLPVSLPCLASWAGKAPLLVPTSSQNRVLSVVDVKLHCAETALLEMLEGGKRAAV
ncbi:hypothetical protein NR798_31135 [Archangium gephyra]|uniref:hypothetical protein n=1 Tax=Archangium gephyra TaxID=48 RepID=UPI0035D4C40E